MKNIVQPLLVICLLGTGLQASAKGNGKVDLRFLAERVPEEVGEVILAAGDHRSPSFKLSARSLSDPVVAPARVTELRMGNGRTKLADIVIPDNGKKHFVVLLVPADQGYSAIVIPGKTAKFREGDAFIYNHTPKTVVGYVGTAKFSIEPGKGEVVRPTGAKKESFFDVAFGVREESGNRLLRSMRWPVMSQSRSYVFFFSNPKTARIDFRAVDEYLPALDPVLSSREH